MRRDSLCAPRAACSGLGMSPFQRVLGAALLFLFVPAVHACENPYDVLGKVLAPYTQVIAGSSKTKNCAITMQLQLEEAGGADPKLAGTRVEFVVEMPDRLRVTGPFAGERITVCREG